VLKFSTFKTGALSILFWGNERGVRACEQNAEKNICTQEKKKRDSEYKV